MKKLLFFVLTWFISIATFAQMGYGIFTVKNLEMSNTKGSDYGILYLNDDKVIFSSPLKEKRRKGPSGIFEGSVNSEGEILNKKIITDVSKVYFFLLKGNASIFDQLPSDSIIALKILDFLLFTLRLLYSFVLEYTFLKLLLEK